MAKECLNCQYFVADNPDTPEEETACTAEVDFKGQKIIGRPDFRKQLISGQTTDCDSWLEK